MSTNKSFLDRRNQLLQVMVDNGVSDLFLTFGAAPAIRLYGEIVTLEEGIEPLDEATLKGLIDAILETDERRKQFKDHKEADFAFSFDKERFRVNVFQQRGHPAAALRYLPSRLYTLEELGLPAVFREATERGSGIVLIAGPTGSGKSTSLASLIDHINENERRHIITIEDPIEYIHHHKKSIIEQREVGIDTETYERALLSTMRESPDIVMVGEMRDLDSMRHALTLAETGHLIFSTIHARSSALCVSKIVDSFPAEEQAQIRLQLADSIVGIFSQRLIRNVGGNGMVLATETMVSTNAIRNLIRENKTHQINSSIQVGLQDGMHLLEDDMARLIQEGRIRREDAMKQANDPGVLLKVGHSAAVK